MTENEHQQVIEELQTLINDTQQTLTQFEEKGMDEEMPADYERLLGILDGAIKQQREHTLAMLSE
ncbi:hypothetical protein ELY33_17685 [Vreelandella andesensis]|uniref:Uncharacterized protein n=1 Tax=Vreelandella andesensis TaxID=447567 RepID=A0A433KEF9_9GAMM|nr:hypothetical protein [Halomonas andesensis]RUR25699.1 hypothetical protein ELY33_17685 [Halomonas andesensis]